MTPHRLANIAMTAAIVLTLAATLSTAHLLDHQPDRRAEHTQASALADAQQAAQRAARQERAAAQLCARMHGNAGYRWSEDGTLVCTDHRGRVSVTVAGGPRS